REAAFPVERRLLAQRFDLRIEHRRQRYAASIGSVLISTAGASGRDEEDDDPPRYVDLRCGQSHAARICQGVDHVADEPVQLRVCRRSGGFRRRQQDRVTHPGDLQYGHLHDSSGSPGGDVITPLYRALYRPGGLCYCAAGLDPLAICFCQPTDPREREDRRTTCTCPSVTPM